MNPATGRRDDAYAFCIATKCLRILSFPLSQYGPCHVFFLVFFVVLLSSPSLQATNLQA
ncbi:uncharacterized protein BDZ99DRAFT_467579 [Mytilinidion resinicola]|uniref:Uncharacterized protein n=1 Tax=Mytilinidion resinicola TaxID=574789 RepID=A0A6A6Y8K5_9PEZI|nr:uncharacterized protein BDZ99DRAFT_467579 [Mytilinidion resinicola]KAF2804294.1 hypothetical protein BDZ99DRAFT_467579 [Mytilinidion resinicola]